MSGHGLFVTGTDTGVGKTLVSAALLYLMADLGLRAVGMKPVAAGASLIDGVWANEDVLALRAASGVAADAAEINPYLLREAIAPHIAAERKGVRIEIPRIVAAYDGLAARADWVVVEGAGGLCVPLGPSQDFADLAVALKLPVLLVVGMRLGCLNHALLSAEAIERRGLRLAGWVANPVEAAMPAYAENRDSLAARLPAPLLAELLFMNEPTPRHAARYLAPHRLHGWLAGLTAGAEAVDS